MKNINILKWALVVGIVVVLNLFINFSVALVYDMPEWDKFCVQEQVTITPTDEKACVDKGGAWTVGSLEEFSAQRNNTQPKGWCDVNFTCQKEYTEANSVYNRNVFIILVVSGVLALGLGLFLNTYTAVALGLSFGGVGSFIVGTVRYWSDMDDYLRVIVLGLALVSLIWLGIKKIKD